MTNPYPVLTVRTFADGEVTRTPNTTDDTDDTDDKDGDE